MKRTPIKRRSRQTIPKEIKDHWARIVALGCAVKRTPRPTIHHVHGGSIREAFGSKAMPGMGQKQNHWLVIPLHPELHTGNLGIDTAMSVTDWERSYGTQAEHLQTVRDSIMRLYGYCIYEKAGVSPIEDEWDEYEEAGPMDLEDQLDRLLGKP